MGASSSNRQSQDRPKSKDPILWYEGPEESERRAEAAEAAGTNERNEERKEKLSTHRAKTSRPRK